jgi:lipopolysaccharide transport protein LptA
MRKLPLCLFFCLWSLARVGHAQTSAPATLSSPIQGSAENSPTGKAKAPAEKKKEAKGESAEKAKDSSGAAPAAELPVTEIFSDEAFFDSAKYIGIFTGHVIVNDARFNVQGDKLTIYLSRKQNEGFEKAIVEGNVGVVRQGTEEPGATPSRAVGRAEKGVYVSKDGSFELTGNPRVQQGLNTHVATSPETVMVINNAGQLTTHGPSRTEIRQEPSPQASPTP